MKISSKAKSIIKKVALVLAGITAITAVAFGVKAIVDYTKNDLKEINPGFEVGSLGSDGKYVADEGSLYTKEAFGCYGLQIKPDFDATVNYQLFYYDILDNYISSSEVLSAGYSDEIPLNAAYARIVITPRDDEDGKIGFFEIHGYASQLSIKVKKQQDINNRFVSFGGKVLSVVYNVNDMVFVNHTLLNSDTFTFDPSSSFSCTCCTFLSVDQKNTVKFTKPDKFKSNSLVVFVFEFSDLPSKETFVNVSTSSDNYEFSLNKKTRYILLQVDFYEGSFDDGDMSILSSSFSIK